METEAINSRQDTKWILLLSLFVLFLGLFVWLKRPNTIKWLKFSEQEQQEILKNYEIWEKLDEKERKEWKTLRDRYQAYHAQEKKFLQHLFQDWQQLPHRVKSQRLSSWKIYKTLSTERRQKIRCHSIFLESFHYEMGYLPSPPAIQQWGFDLQSLEKEKMQHCGMQPLSLRRHIYDHIVTLKMLEVLPASLQKSWKQMPLEERLSLLNEVEEKIEKQHRTLFLKLLKEKIESNREK